MAYGIPRNLESQYNVLTVPNYVKNLVVTASPGTIHAAYTAPCGGVDCLPPLVGGRAANSI